MLTVKPITLEGAHVRLEPLTRHHFDALAAVAFDEDLWRWTVTQMQTPDDLRAYIEVALHAQSEGHTLPFVTIDKRTNTVVGTTRFADIDPKNRNVEIGYTWIAPAWQRTHINTEAKYLMLEHAFETWHARRVFLKTDVLNERSRRAIERLGAQQEGIFRRHLITATGRIRDSIYYSIIDDEWRAVKARLQAMLNR